MGGGNWDGAVYKSATTTRSSMGIDDFDYSSKAKDVHETLSALRIKDKPFGMLESRDNDDHPESNAVFINFDVTGSNIDDARIAQKEMDKMMDLLPEYLDHPQLAFGANDDIEACMDSLSFQVTEFESDNRIDESLRNIVLVGQGGGNNHESYDLALFAAARLMALDCVEKRGKKGYMFMYADEPFPAICEKGDIQSVFGITIERDLTIEELIEEVKEKFHLFVMFPAKSSYHHSLEQYKELVGEDFVVTLQHPTQICAIMCGIIGMLEEKVSHGKVSTDLVKYGFDGDIAKATEESLQRFANRPYGAAKPPAMGSSGGASRL